MGKIIDAALAATQRKLDLDKDGDVDREDWLLLKAAATAEVRELEAKLATVSNATVQKHSPLYLATVACGIGFALGWLGHLLWAVTRGWMS